MAEISQVVKDALYEHASYDFDFNEYGDDYMGENLPTELGLDDLECLASERCVSMHTILLEHEYFKKGELDWE